MFRFSFGIGFGFFFGKTGDFDVFCAVEFVHGADNNKDNKGYEEKVDDILDEVAVGDVGDRVGAKEVRDVEGEAGKVETAGEKTGDWHDDIIDKGLNDGGKSSTPGDTDGEIDDATAVDKFFELLDEVAFCDACDESSWGGARNGSAVFGSVRGG